jgi:hypothetical protein
MMRATLTATTGAKILVWREDEVLHSRRVEAADRAQICLAVDLFEVIAELAGLDLEQPEQAEEAVSLAEQALTTLGIARGPDPGPETVRAPDGAS